MKDLGGVAVGNLLDNTVKKRSRAHFKTDIYSSAINLLFLFLDSGEDFWSVRPASESC